MHENSCWTEEEVRDLLSQHQSLASAATEVNLSRERLRQLAKKFGITKFTWAERRIKLKDEDLWLLDKASLYEIAKILNVSAERLRRVYPNSIRQRGHNRSWARSIRRKVVIMLSRDGETHRSIAKIFNWKSMGAITRLLTMTGNSVGKGVRTKNWKPQRAELIKKTRHKVVRDILFASKAVYAIVYSQKDKKLRYNL